MSLTPEHLDDSSIMKYIQQVERKREYNRQYYRSKVKPQKEIQKQELEQLREQNTELQSKLITSEEIESMRLQISTLSRENQELSAKLHRTEQELAVVKKALEVARHRNYELLMQKADEFLPPLHPSSH